jgi:hypothetical protein
MLTVVEYLAGLQQDCDTTTMRVKDKIPVQFTKNSTR